MSVVLPSGNVPGAELKTIAMVACGGGVGVGGGGVGIGVVGIGVGDGAAPVTFTAPLVVATPTGLNSIPSATYAEATVMVIGVVSAIALSRTLNRIVAIPPVLVITPNGSVVSKFSLKGLFSGGGSTGNGIRSAAVMLTRSSTVLL